MKDPRIDALEALRKQKYEERAAVFKEIESLDAQINSIKYNLTEGEEFMLDGVQCMVTDLRNYFPRFVKKSKKGEWSKNENLLYDEMKIVKNKE